jgi:ABC-type molybdate transport system substrate-binding protein
MNVRLWWIGLLALLAACAGRGVNGPAPEPEPLEPRTDARNEVLVVYAAPTLAALVERLAAVYEAENPDIRVRVRTGQRGPVLDPWGNIARDINAGAAVDVLAAERAWQIDELTRPPPVRRQWLGNELVAVTGRASRLRLIDLSTGWCGVAVALERTALGRDSRASLEARGVWSTVAERVERFDDAAAILERARWGADSEHVLGIVYRTDARGAAAEGTRVVGRLALPAGEELVHELAAWTPRGEALVAWLTGEHAAAVAREMGFGWARSGN